MIYLVLGGISAALIAVGLWGLYRGIFPKGPSVFLIVVSASQLLAGADFVLDRATCVQHGERLGVPTEYRAVSGCYVKTGDGMVPYDWWVSVTQDGGR